MNTPLSWIKAYVPELTCTEQEYMDAMTMSGTKVEGYEKFDADLDKIIVGKLRRLKNTRMQINWLSARWQLMRKEQQRRL